MNRKQLITSLVILAVVGLSIYFILKKDISSWNSSKYSATGENLLADLDVNKITGFVVSSGKQTATLKRNDDGSWIISEKDSYPGDYQKILNFLKNLPEIKTVQNINAGKSQFEKLGLADSDKEKGTAIALDFIGESGKKLASFLIGKKHFKKEENPMPFMGGGMSDGCYVLLADGKLQPRLVNNSFESISADPMSWTDKSFFDIENIISMESKRKNPDESWKLVKDEKTDKLTLADIKDGELLDEGKIQMLNSFLKYVAFKDVKICPADFTGESLKIEAGDGFKYDICFALNAENPGQYHVNIKATAAIPENREAGKDEKPEDKDRLDKEFKAKEEKLREKLDREKSLGKWLYTLSKGDMSSVLDTRKDFLKTKDDKKAEGPTENAPAMQ